MRSITELAAEICTLAGRINAAHHRWLTLIAEFDDRKGWSDGSTQSCAHWLNWKCGLAMGAAREKVRVARALGKLPKVAVAMERGSLSYSKVAHHFRATASAPECPRQGLPFSGLRQLALHRRPPRRALGQRR